ncbi:MAG TPA: hypothetical protein VE504_06110 [Nitrososphaeraceae archaeon]|jgi:hypothetical protein|nr:hypothetical protein [Nitrososphaeraceae archaeon]
MRLPLKDTQNSNVQEVNSIFYQVGECYLRSISPKISMQEVNVMLADGTVTQSPTFDIGNVLKYFENLVRSLSGWQISGIFQSKVEDLNRIYCEFRKTAGKYDVRGYFGIQFHALPYYQVNKKVLDIQKNLRQLEDKGIQYYSQISQQANKTIEEELSLKGLAKMSDDELFKNLLENEGLYGDLVKKAESVESEFPQFLDIDRQRKLLIQDLENLVIELYQVSPVLIDYNKLMQGEAGVVMYVDVGTIKNEKTGQIDSFVNTKRWSSIHSHQIISTLIELRDAMDRI